MRYQKGVSGNPVGRPRDIKDKRTAMRELLEPHANELVAKVVEMAKNGDSTAMRICIDRLIPPAKAREEPVSLPVDSGSLAEKGQAVLAALGEGAIAPDIATAILQGIAAQARIIEVDEIGKRLSALEEAKQGISR